MLVLDRNGRTRVILHDDNANPHTIEADEVRIRAMRMQAQTRVLARTSYLAPARSSLRTISA